MSQCQNVVLDKLEQVFNIAAERYISSKGFQGDLKEIESLGTTIINFKNKSLGTQYPGVVPKGSEPSAQTQCGSKKVL